MKKIELLFLTSAGVAILMNLFLIPFGGMLTILIMSTLALVYIPYGFFAINELEIKDLSHQETFNTISPLRSIGGIGLGISISVILIGSMFKLMTWPGANFMLYVGISALSVVLVVSLIRFFMNRSRAYFFVFTRGTLFVLLGLFLAGLPKYAIMEYKYRDYPSYMEAIKSSNEDPGNKELRKRVNEERLKMERQ